MHSIYVESIVSIFVEILAISVEKMNVKKGSFQISSK